MMRVVLASVVILVLDVGSGLALTERQKQGMRFHGSWEWAIRTCPGFYRSYGYWFALKEAGGFKNQVQIVEHEDDADFRSGWDMMRNRAGLNGLKAACEFALETWPAVFIMTE